MNNIISFSGGNKRTGLECALAFLKINNAAIIIEKEDSIALSLDVATGKMTIGLLQ